MIPPFIETLAKDTVLKLPEEHRAQALRALLETFGREDDGISVHVRSTDGKSEIHPRWSRRQDPVSKKAYWLCGVTVTAAVARSACVEPEPVPV